MKTLLSLYKLLLPLGLAIFIATQILGYYTLVTDFTKGFLEGMSLVFIVAGLSVIIGSHLGNKKKG